MHYAVYITGINELCCLHNVDKCRCSQLYDVDKCTCHLYMDDMDKCICVSHITWVTACVSYMMWITYIRVLNYVTWINVACQLYDVDNTCVSYRRLMNTRYTFSVI